jgi:hypothetical protein
MTKMKSNSVLPRESRMNAKNTAFYLPETANAVNLAGVGMPERVGLSSGDSKL